MSVMRRIPMRFVKPVMDNGEMRIADHMLFVVRRRDEGTKRFKVCIERVLETEKGQT